MKTIVQTFRPKGEGKIAETTKVKPAAPVELNIVKANQKIDQLESEIQELEAALHPQNVKPAPAPAPTKKASVSSAPSKNQDAEENKVYWMRFGTNMSRADYMLVWCAGYALIGNQYGGTFEVLCNRIQWSYKNPTASNFAPINKDAFNHLVSAGLTQEELFLKCQRLAQDVAIPPIGRKTVRDTFNKEVDFHDFIVVRR